MIKYCNLDQTKDELKIQNRLDGCQDIRCKDQCKCFVFKAKDIYLASGIWKIYLGFESQNLYKLSSSCYGITKRHKPEQVFINTISFPHFYGFLFTSKFKDKIHSLLIKTILNQNIYKVEFEIISFIEHDFIGNNIFDYVNLAANKFESKIDNYLLA